MHILHTSLYISKGADNENLFYNKELPKLVIISIWCLIQGWYRKELLDASYSNRSKV